MQAPQKSTPSPSSPLSPIPPHDSLQQSLLQQLALFFARFAENLLGLFIAVKKHQQRLACLEEIVKTWAWVYSQTNVAEEEWPEIICMLQFLFTQTSAAIQVEIHERTAEATLEEHFEILRTMLLSMREAKPNSIRTSLRQVLQDCQMYDVFEYYMATIKSNSLEGILQVAPTCEHHCRSVLFEQTQSELPEISSQIADLSEKLKVTLHHLQQLVKYKHQVAVALRAGNRDAQEQSVSIEQKITTLQNTKNLLRSKHEACCQIVTTFAKCSEAVLEIARMTDYAQVFLSHVVRILPSSVAQHYLARLESISQSQRHAYLLCTQLVSNVQNRQPIVHLWDEIEKLGKYVHNILDQANVWSHYKNHGYAPAISIDLETAVIVYNPKFESSQVPKHVQQTLLAAIPSGMVENLNPKKRLRALQRHQYEMLDIVNK